jgi:hypothetical protein|tara:strand:+ start:323433 stop:324125 length:693 start_codon:yes stop_codon:yes gene_type:complete
MDDDMQEKGIQSEPALVFSYNPMELILTICASAVTAFIPLFVAAFPWLLGITNLMGVEDPKLVVGLSFGFSYILLYVIAECIDVKLGDSLGRTMLALEVGVLLGSVGAIVVVLKGEILEYFLHIYMVTMAYVLVSGASMVAMGVTNEQYKWPARLTLFVAFTGMLAGALFYAILAKEGDASIYTTHELTWVALGSMTVGLLLAGFNFYRGLLGDIRARDDNKQGVNLTSV